VVSDIDFRDLIYICIDGLKRRIVTGLWWCIPNLNSKRRSCNTPGKQSLFAGMTEIIVVYRTTGDNKGADLE